MGDTIVDLSSGTLAIEINALACVALLCLCWAFHSIFYESSIQKARFFGLMSLGWLANFLYLVFMFLETRGLLRLDPNLEELSTLSLNTAGNWLFLAGARLSLRHFWSSAEKNWIVPVLSIVVLLVPFLDCVLFGKVSFFSQILSTTLGAFALYLLGQAFAKYFEETLKQFSSRTKYTIVISLWTYAVLQFGYVLRNMPWIKDIFSDIEPLLFLAGFLAKVALIYGLLMFSKSTIDDFNRARKSYDAAMLSAITFDQFKHELATPAEHLRIKAPLIDAIASKPDSSSLRSVSESLIRPVEQITALVQQFDRYRLFESDPRFPAKRESLNVNIICDNVVKDLKNVMNIGYKVETKYSSGVIVNAVESDLYHIFRNIVKNAFESLSVSPAEGKRLTIHTRQIIGYDKKIPVVAQVDFVDNGIGFPYADRGRLFKTMYTTKSGKGRGHGLAIAKKLVLKYRGKIEADSPDPDSGKGARFRVTLPSDELKTEG
jgi:signal transduction histidine kinase